MDSSLTAMADPVESQYSDSRTDSCCPVEYKATVVITTKDRRNELRIALRSACQQNAAMEILVLDDGSTDGTADMVRTEFPSVRVERYEQSAGLVVRRNQGAKLATAPVIISIDDDAAFSSPHIVSRTLTEFDHPRVGAVAIPFVNVNQDSLVRQLAPCGSNIHATHSFIGTAHAIRRDLFLTLGGYREYLFHQGEECDFCVRLLAAGYVVRLGTADPIHHFESPRRDFRRMDYYGRRNDILFAWHNVPRPYLPVHLAGVTYHGLLHGVKLKRPLRMAWGLWHGYLNCLRQWTERRPINSSAYRLYRRLRRHGCLPLKDVEHDLPIPKFG